MRVPGVLWTAPLFFLEPGAGGDGRDAGPGGGLGEPPAGVGEFVTLLVRMGFPVLPAGVSEPRGRLTISFGEPFVPDIPADKARRDGSVTGQVMDAIARQLDDA